MRFGIPALRPGYLARQLYDIQHGTRKGPAVALDDPGSRTHEPRRPDRDRGVFGITGELGGQIYYRGSIKRRQSERTSKKAERFLAEILPE
jgi:hypothetical protein